jgi:hypothetical protein
MKIYNSLNNYNIIYAVQAPLPNPNPIFPNIVVQDTLEVDGVSTFNGGAVFYNGLTFSDTISGQAYGGITEQNGLVMNQITPAGTPLQVNERINTSGYQTRTGLSGPSGTNYFNLYWDGSNLQLYIDNNLIGTVNITT